MAAKQDAPPPDDLGVGAGTGEEGVGNTAGVGEEVGDDVGVEVGEDVGVEVGEDVGVEVGEDVGGGVGVEVGGVGTTNRESR